MENRLVLADTSIFIEYFRKSKKSQTQLYRLLEKGFEFCVSSVTYFEYRIGSKDPLFDKALFEGVEILPFDKAQAETATRIYKQLKSANRLIEFRDLFIASCAITHKTPPCNAQFDTF